MEPFLAAFGFALLAALSKPVLYRPGVADLLKGKAGDHHDLLRTEEREPLSQHRQHNRVQIRAAGEDLLTAGGQLALGSQRQGEQVQQRIEIWLLAQLLQADPVHFLQNCLQQPGRIGWSQSQAVMGRNHHHLQVLHPGVTLYKAQALG